MGVEVAKAIITVMPETALINTRQAWLKLSAVMYRSIHRSFPLHMHGSEWLPLMEMMPHATMRISRASPMAMPSIRGMRMLVE